MLKVEDLFDLSQTEHAALFDGCEFAWDALKKLKPYIEANLRPGQHQRMIGSAHIGEQVFIGEGTVIEAGVMINQRGRCSQLTIADLAEAQRAVRGVGAHN